MSWLKQLLDATDEAESPKSFITWSGLSVLSAVVKSNVWLQKGGLFKLYPTMYVLLVANSGACRKSFGPSVAEKIMEKVNNTRILSGRISIQALLTQLGTAYTVEGESRPRTDAAAFIPAGEFSSSFVRDPDVFTILTNLYDNHYHGDSYKSILKTAGTDHLKNIAITLLGAINQDHFDDLMQAKDIYGGFIARCMIVLEKKRSRVNAMIRNAPFIDYDVLAEYPKQLAKLKGPMILTEEAISSFESWYNTYPMEEIQDKTGLAARIHDHILKVATLISLSYDTSMTVTGKHMNEAMSLVLEHASRSKFVTQGAAGKSKSAVPLSRVTGCLLNAPNGIMSRTSLLKRLYGDVDAFELDSALTTLTSMGGVLVETADKETIYKISPNWMDQYKEKLIETKMEETIQ